MDSLTEDKQARKYAQSSFHNHIILEAGAGTGKTATLVSRVVTWALGIGWIKQESALQKHKDNPELELIAWEVARRVVAITFTEKAAQEMADRIGLALQSLSVAQIITNETVVAFDPDLVCDNECEPLPHSIIRERAQALMAVADQLTIKTIHSYCRKLLSRFPQEARLHLSFSIDADGSITDRFVTEVLLQDLNLAFQDTSHPQKSQYEYILSKGIELTEIAKTLQDLIAKGILPTDFDYDPSARGSSKLHYIEIIETMEFIRLAYEDEKLSAVHQRIYNLIIKLVPILENYIGNHQISLPEHEETLINLWSDPTMKQAINDWKNQAKKSTAIAKTKELQSYFEQIKPKLIALPNYKPYFLNQVRSLLQHLLFLLRDKLRKRGVQTFGDLLSYASYLLSNHDIIAKTLSNEIDLLLVDEFQDTSELQCKFIEGLISHEDSPLLFIVGDPKQAIYGWRNADISSYFKFVEKLCKQYGAQRYSLLQNFRSTPNILDEVSRVIKPIMKEHNGLQPPFRELIPYRSTELFSLKTNGYSSVTYWVTWPEYIEKRVKVAESRQIESKMVASEIHSMVSSGQAKYKDCAILFRSMTNIETYIDELRKLKIPYVVSGDRNYYKRREIIEVSALMRCIFSPTDQVALVSLLRSSLVGLPDFALYPLWKEGFPQYFQEAKYDTIPHNQMERYITALKASAYENRWITGTKKLGPWIDRFVYIIYTLFELRSDFTELSTDMFFNKLRRRTLIEVIESSAYQGAYRIANLERFFQELQSEVEKDSGQWGRVLEYLRRAIQQALDQKEARPQEAADNSVQLMTIHKSKGLDFSHVYLMEFAKSEPSSSLKGTYILKEENKTAYSLLGVATLDYPFIVDEAQIRSRYERVRLLYVAMTRAKNRLIISGNFPLTTSHIEIAKAKSFMDLLYITKPEPGRFVNMTSKLIDLHEQISSGVNKHTMNDVQIEFYVEKDKQNIDIKPIELLDFDKHLMQQSYLQYETDRDNMYVQENKVVGELVSSVICELQNILFNKMESEKTHALRQLFTSALSLIHIGNKNIIFSKNWSKYLMNNVRETSTDKYTITTIEMVHQIEECKNTLYLQQQGECILQGETILLDPSVYQAKYQEYIIQRMIVTDGGYRLIEFVWQWDLLVSLIPNILEKNLLMHTVSQKIENKFNLNTGSISCELWDLSDGTIYYV
jgi:ATP-dependent helicase/nuclease subunit A